MKFIIVSDMFSLDSWLIDGKEPEIMPAVYELYKFLGNHNEHSFDAVIAHPNVNRTIEFPNGSRIFIYKLGVPFHYLRKFVSLNFLKRKANDLIQQNNNYTHVYGMTIYANVARQIGKEKSIPSVGRLFGSLIWDVLQKGEWFKSRTRFHYQMKEIKYPCDLTICTEDGTEFDRAIQLYNKIAQVEMMYNGMNEDFRNELMDLPIISQIDSSKKINFCYIARLSSWKRQDLALKFIAQLKSKGLNISLDFFGRGETAGEMQKLTQELNLEDVVSFKGSIPHVDIPKILSQYQVCMFYYDASNLGNAMWESSLSGRLILTRDTGKTTKIFNRKNALIMEGESVNKLADDFIDLLDSKFDLASSSRKDVDQLLPSWSERLEKEMNIISSIKI